VNHTQPSDRATDGLDQPVTEKDGSGAGRNAGPDLAGHGASAGDRDAAVNATDAELAAEPGEPADAREQADGADASGGENAQPDPDGEAEKYRQEAENAKREAEETYQRLLRLQADYDNFRRRTRLEKEEIVKYASLSLVEKLLPVLDNFERALAAAQHAADLESFAKGVDMIHRQLADVLAQEGLEPIKAVGEPFNPEVHQAVMQVESEEYDDNVVVEELQKGYKLKEKVIRPSMVKVNARP
jgi:molecular chaperone GrpE